MNRKPLISVIIPAFQSAQYLRESIESIEAQTYSNIEIIIVDDTPIDDGTQSILDSFHDKRIKYIKPEQRLGIVKSLNYAVKISNGEFIARMDADDISHSKRIEKQAEYLLEHEDVGVVGCNCYTINERGKVIGCIVHPTDNDDIKAKMMFNVAFIHPSVMIRKNFLIQYPYNESCFCCEDYELWSRLMKVTKFHNLKEKLFKYRIQKNGAMQSQLQRLQEEEDYYRKHVSILKLAYDNVLSYYKKNGLDFSKDYVDLTFAKKLDRFSIQEREAFLSKYQIIIGEKCHSGYLSKCIHYQWIKMAKGQFWKTKKISWIVGCLQEMVISVINSVTAKVLGAIAINRKEYVWKL